MPNEEPEHEAKRHLHALRRNPNGARVIAGSLRTMARDLVDTVLAMTSENRNAAYRARDKAIRLARYMKVVYQEYDDERGEWRNEQ